MPKYKVTNDFVFFHKEGNIEKTYPAGSILELRESEIISQEHKVALIPDIVKPENKEISQPSISKDIPKPPANKMVDSPKSKKTKK